MAQAAGGGQRGAGPGAGRNQQVRRGQSACPALHHDSYCRSNDTMSVHGLPRCLHTCYRLRMHCALRLCHRKWSRISHSRRPAVTAGRTSSMQPCCEDSASSWRCEGGGVACMRSCACHTQSLHHAARQDSGDVRFRTIMTTSKGAVNAALLTF